MCFGDTKPAGDLLDRARTQQKDFVSQLTEEHLRLSLEELVKVKVERAVTASTTWLRVDGDNQYEYKMNLFPDIGFINVP